MKRYRDYLLIVFVFLFASNSLAFAMAETNNGEGMKGNSYAVLNASIMRPDKATRAKWYQAFLNAPQSYLDPVIEQKLTLGATKPVPLYLDHITYTPSDRNQGGCGNCWVWAGTGLLETKHSVENGVKDRLSIQWLDSRMYAADNYYACKGGTLGGFVNFYNRYSRVPWSNTNAQFQDSAGGTAPHVAYTSISTSPNYNAHLNALVAATIPTTGQTQATAIANIKNILAQNKAVQFNFWLANQADWNTFFSFWNNQTEATLWNPDPLCSHSEGTGSGGHAVVIVGYDDTNSNPANHYWLVLNSWGTNAKRPNGLFRMKMNMNYSCKVYSGTNYYYSREFQNIETAAGKLPFFDTNALFMGTQGASTKSLWFRERSTNGPWSTWSMMDGTASATPAQATFNTKLYIARKGGSSATDQSIWIRSINASGARSSWTNLSGTTDAAPALVTYRNKLYLFKNNVGANTINYRSMSPSGTWSGWATVPGSNTPYAPSVVAYNDQLHVFVTDTLGRVIWSSMSSNGSWSPWAWFPSTLRTNAAPAATVFDNRVHLVAKGKLGATNANNISLAATSPAGMGSWYTWSEIPGSGRTSRAPQVGVGPDVKTLNVTVTGENANSLWSQQYIKGTGWNSSWTWTNGSSIGAPSINTYWFRAEPYPTSPRLESELSEPELVDVTASDIESENVLDATSLGSPSDLAGADLVDAEVVESLASGPGE